MDSQTNFTMYHSKFVGNTAENDAGAVYAGVNSNLRVLYSSFKGVN